MMTKTITEIFQEVQPLGHSMSIARKHFTLGNVRFNGEQVTSLSQEVEVENGSAFQVNESLFKFDGEWILHRPLKDKTEYHMKLGDSDSLRDDETPGEIGLISDEAICKVRRIGDRYLLIGVEGYGEKNGNGDGFPILIELHGGELLVRLWADINQEDPTHCISMEGARENARTPE